VRNFRDFSHVTSKSGEEERVLDPSKSLSYYNIKSSDTLIFSKKEEGTQSVSTEERVFEVTVVNIKGINKENSRNNLQKGDEEKRKLNFSIPVAKVISSMCYHYGYEEDPTICLKVNGNPKSCMFELWVTSNGLSGSPIVTRGPGGTSTCEA
jgi:hypothetical protein